MRIEVQPAISVDAPAIADVLREATTKMLAAGARGWRPDEIDVSRVTAWIEKGKAVVALSSSEIVGVMLVQWRDPIHWPDRDDGLAAYLHKIAIRRSGAGTGVPAALVAWAVDHARALGKRRLRVDCGPWPRLCAVYERLGFVEVDRIPVDDGISVRFERQL